MIVASSHTARNDLATLFGVGAIGGLPDAELLARFVDGRGDAAAEAAFEVLVSRHGPMVFGVCRRVLGDAHAAADAFQATFLILVRKAPLVRVEGSLGRWLYGVSRRVARRARAGVVAERSRMRALNGFDAPGEAPPPDRDELREAIDEEIARLPAHYRSAVVLCYLEGLTQDQAARRLVCPVGTIESRLHRARERLRLGLTRRGLAPIALSSAALAAATARAEVPPSLAAATVALAARGGLVGMVPAVAALVGHSLRSMRMIKVAWVGLVAMALGMGLVVAGAGVGPSRKPQAPAAKVQTPGAQKAKVKAETGRAIEGTVRDPLGKPIAGATVVVGLDYIAKANHHVVESDKDGRFAWPVPDGEVSIFLAAYKKGLAPTTTERWIPADKRPDRVELKLDVTEPFSAVLVDGEGRPMAGAQVRVEMFANSQTTPQPDGKSSTTMTSYGYVRRDVIGGSPLEGVFEATTDRDGSFALPMSPGPWLRLAAKAKAKDGAEMRIAQEKLPAGAFASHLAEEGFVGASPKGPTRLIAYPTAKLAGRVTTKMSGVDVAGLKIWLQDSNPPGAVPRHRNTGARLSLIGEDGRFAIGGLDEGTVNVFVFGKGEGEQWTYRAGRDVALKPGKTAEIGIELIAGVAVDATVVTTEGKPAEGVMIGVYGPYRPRSGAATQSRTTDAKGRFHYRLPSGETFLYVMGAGPNFITLPDNGSSQTVTIPDDAKSFAAPPIKVLSVVVLHGRVVDATGKPVPGATLVGVLREPRAMIGQQTQPAGVADERGVFQLAGENGSAPPGRVARFVVRMPDGREVVVEVTPTADGSVTVKLPDGD